MSQGLSLFSAPGLWRGRGSMRRGLLLAAAFGFAATVSAQVQPAPATPQFKAATRLVQISVVVHDKNGQPVGDLTAADFELTEDGKEQPIQFFSIETSDRRGASPEPGRWRVQQPSRGPRRVAASP